MAEILDPLSTVEKIRIKGRFIMPRKDGTGPNAMGAMTGRGAGNCVGGQNRGNVKNGSGRGINGRGLCGWFKTSELVEHSPEENEEKILREQADALKKKLDEVNKDLSELKK
jgi:hypothetical protein